MNKTFALVPVFSALVACGAGSGGSDPVKFTNAGSCTFITGGGTTVTAITPGSGVNTTCTFDNPGNSIDGNGDTATDIQADAVTSGDCALRVVAQSGVVFPAGNVASVLALLSWSGAATPVGDHYAIARTLLNGEVQDEVQFSQADPGVAVDGVHGTGKVFFDIPTTKPFDSVELSVGSPAREQTAQVFEFCSDHQ